MKTIWTQLTDGKPVCLESRELILEDIHGNHHAGHCYSGTIEGSPFIEFFFEINNTVAFAEIPD